MESAGELPRHLVVIVVVVAVVVSPYSTPEQKAVKVSPDPFPTASTNSRKGPPTP